MHESEHTATGAQLQSISRSESARNVGALEIFAVKQKGRGCLLCLFVYNLALAPTAAEHRQPASPSVPSQR